MDLKIASKFENQLENLTQTTKDGKTSRATVRCIVSLKSITRVPLIQLM